MGARNQVRIFAVITSLEDLALVGVRATLFTGRSSFARPKETALGGYVSWGVRKGESVKLVVPDMNFERRFLIPADVPDGAEIPLDELLKVRFQVEHYFQDSRPRVPWSMAMATDLDKLRNTLNEIQAQYTLNELFDPKDGELCGYRIALPHPNEDVYPTIEFNVQGGYIDPFTGIVIPKAVESPAGDDDVGKWCDDDVSQW